VAYPDWHPSAVSLTLPGGRTFAIAANPTDLSDQPQGNFVVRQNISGGNVTTVWGSKPTLYPHQGITGPEGMAPWKQAQRDFYLKTCLYANALTGQSGMVLVTRFDLTASGRNPATWNWRIDCQDIGTLSSPTPESPVYHAPGKGPL
jgi:hypothetical protein